MKKKLFAILLALTMVLALAACHKTETAEVSTTVATTETSETTTAVTPEEKTATTTTTTKKSVSLEGTYQDKTSQRAWVELTNTSGQTYSIHVHWSSSASESENWTMTGTYNASTGELTYSDCKHVTTTYDDNDNKTEDVHYTNGSGKFVYKNSQLYWTSNQDDGDDVNDCVFAK